MDAVRNGSPSDDKGPTILAVLWVLTGLTTIIVGTRMYIRVRIIQNVGADDYLIGVSLLMGLAYCVVTTLNVAIGYGKHAYVLDEATVEQATFLNTLSYLFGILSFAIPKLAVTALLTRILNPGWWQRVWLWTLASISSAVSGICIILLFTMCNPPQALWQTHLVVEGKATCKDVWFLIDYAIFTGGISAFTDLYLAAYPSTVLMRLHMSLPKRLALCAALGLGSIASAMAIIKCTQLHSLADKSDYTYGTAELVMWTNIESNIVIIASCIPTLQPVLELILGKRSFSSYKASNDRYKGSSKLPDSNVDHNNPFRKTGKSDLTITNIEGQESQESILPDNEYPHKKSHPMGRIRRTDNVTVEYETQDAQARTGSSW